MLTISLTYLALISTAYLILSRIDRNKTRQSLQVAGRSLWMLLPLLFAVFGLVGLFQVFLPPDQVERAMGAANGGMALLVGGALGAVSIGPP
ncbi:MAG: hypothetical protein KAT93_07050, partial [Desulfuromonadales bacterium]|nr:hypothetical protein [Desulfuromonadales bacterium]